VSLENAHLFPGRMRVSLIDEIRVRALRSSNALLILASFLRILFALIVLAAVQLRSAYGQSIAEHRRSLPTNNPLRNQHLVYNVGYSRALCHQQSVKLANILVRYRGLPDKLDLGACAL